MNVNVIGDEMKQLLTTPLLKALRSAVWAALLLVQPGVAAADDFIDGTIPIALVAADGASSGASAVTSITLGDHLGIEGSLDNALMVATAEDYLLSCLSPEVEEPGVFALSGVEVEITAICRRGDQWTFSGVDAISGDRYLLDGKVGIARDGVIAFTGTAYRDLESADQSLGTFTLQ